MFGSTFDFGFGISDIVAQITGLLGNPLVLGLVAASIAVGWAARLTRFAKRVGK
jgi:hypothetical protein